MSKERKELIEKAVEIAMADMAEFGLTEKAARAHAKTMSNEELIAYIEE